jgi:DNA-3-methyladenine glycosylase
VRREDSGLLQSAGLLVVVDPPPDAAAVGVKNRIIRANFFRRDPLTCARELIGAELIWEKCAGKIVETEAYLEEDDEACHTFSRPSARAFINRNQPGAAYIYFSYGAHWMLNVLVKGKTKGFVLFRAVEPLCGIESMKKRRKIDDERQLCSGPGKLTQAFGITNRHHEMNLCVDPRHCFAYGMDDVDVVADERIGISRSAHHRWRFTERGSKFVSRRVKL